MVEDWLETNIDQIYKHDPTKASCVNFKQKVKLKDNIMKYVMNKMIRRLDRIKQKQLTELKRIMQN